MAYTEQHLQQFQERLLRKQAERGTLPESALNEKVQNVLTPTGYFQSLSDEAKHAYLNAVENTASLLASHPELAAKLLLEAAGAFGKLE